MAKKKTGAQLDREIAAYLAAKKAAKDLPPWFDPTVQMPTTHYGQLMLLAQLKPGTPTGDAARAAAKIERANISEEVFESENRLVYGAYIALRAESKGS